MNRFEVLDSWRGIAACMVALFHFECQGHLHDVALVRNAYLFVDFFFVLSGFVIAANYRERLLRGFGVGRFMLLRLGRVYPLHPAMLLLFLAGRTLEASFPSLRAPTAWPPFAAPFESPDTVLANALLVHGLGIFDFVTWNHPSWSISTEVWTYLLFALALVKLRHRLGVALFAAVIAGPLLIAVLSPDNMDTTFDFGLLRCMYGFAAGVIAHQIFSMQAGRFRVRHGTIIELFLIAIVAGFVCMAGQRLISVFAPYVFAPVVIFFAMEPGAISRYLKRPPFLLLGMLSYSIYMVHSFVNARITATARILGFELMNSNAWLGDGLFLAYLILVVGFSWLTYRCIERPARAWSRDLLARHA